MTLGDTWLLLKQKVFPTPSSDTLFNPYHDEHPEFDCRHAAHLRRQNLRGYLDAYREKPPVFLLAEAPGPWGCRFSGVPLVSEAQLVDPEFPLSGTSTSRAEVPHGEYSARIYWRVLGGYFPQFLTWNAVPYHPHHLHRPLSIRTPTAGEVSASLDVLSGVLNGLEPQLVLAVGRKAERALRLVGRSATYVRHPSQGGAKLFEDGVRKAFAEILGR